MSYNPWYLPHLEVAVRTVLLQNGKENWPIAEPEKNEPEIVDSGASGTYLIKNAPKLNERGDAPLIRVGTAS